VTTVRRAAAAVAALAVAVTLVGACSSDRRFPTADDLADIDLTPSHTITVTDEGFDPPRLVIASGEVVVLRNDGDEAHSFSAEERFDTGLLEPGEETTLLLERPGEIPYTDRATGNDAVLVVEPREQ
jgi:plastocyanin